MIAILQLIFVIFAFASLMLYVFVLLLTWSWAQDNEETSLGFFEILTTASIEWGAILSLGSGQILGVKGLWEAPPLSTARPNSKQLPIIFIPSLHTGSGIFRILIWRLKKHFFSSLWPFAWRPFLKSEDLLEDQLLQFIHDVISNTRAQEIRVLSFGSSRPIVARVLMHSSLADYKKKWVAVSAAKTLSKTMKFLSTIRLKNAYTVGSKTALDPDLCIRGTHDVFCYPQNVWGSERSVSVSPIGHYAILMHPTTIQRILDEWST